MDAYETAFTKHLNPGVTKKAWHAIMHLFEQHYEEENILFPRFIVLRAIVSCSASFGILLKTPAAY